MKRLLPILLLVFSVGVGAAEKYCYDLERSNALVTFGNCRGTEAEISKKEFETLKVCKFEARCAPSRLVKKEAVQESPKRAVQESTKTVINTKDSKIAGTGTGFFINGDGHIVTNSHVIKGCASLTAVQESDSLDTKVIFDDPRNDLALLKVDRQPKVFATFRGGRGIRTAEDILALGYPFQALLSDDLKITKGMVNSLAGLGNDTRMMQISAPVQPGNSGGPLLDHAGNVVGVVTSTMNAVKMAKHKGKIPQNVNFALKASLVRDMLDVKSIDYESASSKKERKAVDIFDRARKYTVLIECRGASGQVASQTDTPFVLKPKYSIVHSYRHGSQQYWVSHYRPKVEGGQQVLSSKGVCIKRNGTIGPLQVAWEWAESCRKSGGTWEDCYREGKCTGTACY